MKKAILIITPVKHITGLMEKISMHFKVIYLPNFKKKDLKLLDTQKKNRIIALLTNPNMSNVRINKTITKNLKSLKYIVTASTGTNHIDNELISKNNLELISLTKDLSVTRKISSTSELAFALTLAAVRNIHTSNLSVKKGEWKYLPFVGRQLNGLTIGIIGFGRLGKIYYKFAKAFNSKILVNDPYIKKSKFKNITFVSLQTLAKKSDIISCHIHHTDETEKIISRQFLKKVKKNLILINTSRGEIIDEEQVIKFLKINKNSKYYTDVISNEIEGRKKNIIYQHRVKLGNLFITPHIGGMTIEAQRLAYNRVIDRLQKKVSKK